MRKTALLGHTSRSHSHQYHQCPLHLGTLTGHPKDLEVRVGRLYAWHNLFHDMSKSFFSRKPNRFQRTSDSRFANIGRP